MEQPKNPSKKCKACQKEIDQKAKICPYCRTKQISKPVRIISGIITVLLIIWLFSFISGGSSNSSKSADNPAPTNEVVSTRPLTLAEKVKSKLPDDLKDISIDIGDAVQVTNGVVSSSPIPGKKDIVLTEKQGDGFWDINMAKQGGWRAMTDIIKNVFPADNSINSITLIVQSPVTTAYGKKDYAMLESITITRDTYQKIDFANFNSQNIPTIADNYIESHNIKD